MKRVLIVMLLLAACAVSAQAQSDVPKDSWVYSAVSELATKGYVMGYSDASFLGTRTLSRYEFATIVKRILDQTGATFVSGKAEAAGVSADDLNTINKLVDEFKVELAIIGTKIEPATVPAGAVETSGQDMKETLDKLDAIVTDPEGAFEATRADVAKIKKISFSGYIQTRFESDQSGDPANVAKAAKSNTFSVPRARLKITAKPTDKTVGVIEADFAKGAVGVKNAYVQYNFKGDSLIGPYFQMGQMLWPFGYENPLSSSLRETPEYSMVVNRFFPGNYDTGAKVAGAEGKKVFWQLGLYDGSGTAGATQAAKADADGHKDAIGNVRVHLGDLDLGVSGYVGKGIWNSANAAILPGVNKTRYGADLQYYMHNMTFKAEYITGKGVDQAAAAFNQSQVVDGYYAQIAYNLTHQYELVAKYDVLSQDPLYPTFGRRTQWNLGWVDWLDANTRFRIFYTLNNQQFHPIETNALRCEWIITY